MTTHIVYVPFRGVGIDNRNDEWFGERVCIFSKYTLKSLYAQTNKDFHLWLSFRPQDRGNRHILFLERILRLSDIPYVLTFDGLMYHDDKFGGSLSHRLYNAARLVRAAYRNNTWLDLPASLYQMLLKDKNKSLETRLASSLKVLEPHIKEGTVLLTRLDSDDMLHKNAIEVLQSNHIFNRSQPDNIVPECYVFPQGYIHNTSTGEVAEYNPKTNPPFHTLVMNRFTFLDAKKHLASYRGYKSHEDIPHLFEAATLIPNRRMFCVTTSNPKLHISTTWTHPYKGKPVEPAILKEFGL